MKYGKKTIEDKPNLIEVQKVVRAHLHNYMELKDWNKKGLSWHLGIQEVETSKIFNTEINYTLKRLINMAIKTNSKLVISFEPSK